MSRCDYISPAEAAPLVDAAVEEMATVPNLPGDLGEKALRLLQELEAFAEELREIADE